MVTIRDLLNRIRWDREFGAGFFELGYLDHVEHAIVRVPLRNISFEKGDSFSFHLEKETGKPSPFPCTGSGRFIGTASGYGNGQAGDRRSRLRRGSPGNASDRGRARNPAVHGPPVERSGRADGTSRPFAPISYDREA